MQGIKLLNIGYCTAGKLKQSDSNTGKLIRLKEEDITRIQRAYNISKYN